ncbi:MAG: haloacid dehalogenase type II [Chloroflexota bacterium]
MTSSSLAGVGAVFVDLFGTVVSLGSLDAACESLVLGRGPAVAARWRARQLEASWLRTAMERWVDFDVVTREALVATLEEFGVAPPADLDAAAAAFTELEMAEGAREGLEALREAGVVTGILSNASERTLNRITDRLAIPVEHRLSVDPARRFKPHPAVYKLAVEATGLPPERIGFVTSNGWDAAGAGAFGFRVAWLKPGPAATLPAVGAPVPRIAPWSEIPNVFRPGRD